MTTTPCTNKTANAWQGAAVACAQTVASKSSNFTTTKAPKAQQNSQPSVLVVSSRKPVFFAPVSGRTSIGADRRECEMGDPRPADS